MSYLDKLLEGATIEWKTIDDIAIKVSSGGTPRTSMSEYYGGDIPWLRTQEVDFCNIEGTKVKITEAGLNNSSAKMIPADCVIVAMYGATVGKIAVNKIPLSTNQACANIQLDKNIANYRYVFHYLFSKYEFIKSLGTGSQTNISAQTVKKLQIPIPPLKVQKEIVRILDTLTDLKKELTTELTNRIKQYSYYRDQLFKFEEGEIDMKSLNEIGELQRGKRFVKTDMISEGVPCIHYGEMYTYFGTWADKTKSFVNKELVDNKKLRVAKKGDVVIVGAGETIEDIGMGTAWLGDEDVVTHDACFSFRSPLNPKYVAYFTRTKLFHNQIKKHIRTGKISAINAKGLGTAIIPVPNKDEQERIVSILDKFDVLTNSISEGLPKEIDLRQKQYEYYRNMLLTFPKDKIEA